MKCAIFGQISGLITLRQETPFYTACILSCLVQLKDCVLPNNSKNNVVKMLVKTSIRAFFQTFFHVSRVRARVKTMTQRLDYDSKTKRKENK